MEETVFIRKCGCGKLLMPDENIRCAKCLKILHKIVGNYHKKEDATHRINIITKFNPEIISKNEIEKIILTRQDCYEIIEYEFEKDNSVRIVIYIFSVGMWSAESIKSYINGLLANMTIPDGVKKSGITVEVKELS